jgi:hypothetical protein
VVASGVAEDRRSLLTKTRPSTPNTPDVDIACILRQPAAVLMSQDETESLRLSQAKSAQATWSRMEAAAQMKLTGAFSLEAFFAAHRHVQELGVQYDAALGRLKAIGEGGASRSACCFSWQSHVLRVSEGPWCHL